MVFYGMSLFSAFAPISTLDILSIENKGVFIKLLPKNPQKQPQQHNYIALVFRAFLAKQK
jgi:hypothetical protein